MLGKHRLRDLNWRRQLLWACLLGGLLFLVMWFVTAMFGLSGIAERYRTALTSDVPQKYCPGLEIPVERRIAYDSYDLEKIEQLLRDRPPPWYYVGQPYAPMPFVVTVEYGAMKGENYCGGSQVYAIWLFGWTYDFHHDLLWYR